MAQKFDRNLLPEAPDFTFEESLWAAGYQWVAGIDEAGRGALAGPVAAAALIFPPSRILDSHLKGVRDSKQMTPTTRQDWAKRLQDLCLTYGVGFTCAEDFDRMGILPATRQAVLRALQQLSIQPHYLLIDYINLPECNLPQLALTKGDARCLSIAAASIIAKTARDSLMHQQDLRFPGYGFARHKGYGTADHYRAIAKLGPSPIHRRSFRLT